MNGKHTDVWVWLGDNAYGDGLDAEFQSNVFDVYPEIFRNTVSRPAPGNHDYNSLDNVTHDCAYYQNFTMTTQGEAGGIASGTEHYYSFDYGNAHFISLNSEWILYYLNASSSPMINWLKQDLQNSTAKWKIVYWHKPPYTKGSHDSDAGFDAMRFMRENVNPVLEQYGVDLVLTGHSHCYERSYLLKGHYGNSSTFDANSMIVNGTNGNEGQGNPYYKYKNGPKTGVGTVYSVVGCSGSLSSSGTINHRANLVGDKTRYGSLAVNIKDDRMLVKMLDTTGYIFDEYSIIKVDSTFTGIKDFDGTKPSLRVYPNPATVDCYLEYNVPAGNSADAVITDISGKKMWTGKLESTNGILSSYRIPLKNFISGIYTITLSVNGSNTSDKLIVKGQ